MHVIASGCIPAHTSYFLAYENLKIYWAYDNEELNFKTTLCIGATTTFAHDFFIAPSEGKFRQELAYSVFYSDKATSAAVQETNDKTVRSRYY
jgi:hypothetical protein